MSHVTAEPHVRVPPPEGSCRVSVIIPSYNGSELLHSISLPSLARQTFRSFDVSVVDNGSSDDSLRRLVVDWPTVKTISMESNSGFSRAVNRGIRESSGELIALMNNDVELSPHWLERMVATLDAHPSASSVTGKMLDFDDRGKLVSTGLSISWSGVFRERGRGEQDSGQYDVAGPVFSATAGAGLYRRSTFDDVGVFDDEFFAYLEDIDWGFRAQLAGWTCWYVPSARAYHVGRATSKRMPGLYSRLIIRNTIWMILKNFPRGVLVRSAHRIMLVLALRSYRTWRSGDGGPMLAGWIEALMGLPAMLAKRRVIQSRARVDVANWASLVDPPRVDSPTLSHLAGFVRAGRLR